MSSSDMESVYEKEIRERGESSCTVSFLASILLPVVFQCTIASSNDRGAELIELKTCS